LTIEFAGVDDLERIAGLLGTAVPEPSDGGVASS
jgi:hypothetical protein